MKKRSGVLAMTAESKRTRFVRHARAALSVLLALAMVWWQTPAYAVGGAEPDAQGAPAAEQVQPADGDQTDDQQAEAAGAPDEEAVPAEEAEDAADGEDAEQAGDGLAESIIVTPAGRDDQDEAEAEAEDEPQEWTIAFDANGGELRGAATKPIENVVADETTAKLPRDPAIREGYEFVGWNTVPDPEAPGVAEKDVAFVPERAELYNLTYSYVVLTESNATTEELEAAIRTPDGRMIALVGRAEAESSARDAAGREIKTADLRPMVKDGVLTLYAQWVERAAEPADDEGEAAAENDGAGAVPGEPVDVSSVDESTLNGATYTSDGTVSAASVQGDASSSLSAAASELGGLQISRNQVLEAAAGTGLVPAPSILQGADADADDADDDTDDADDAEEVPRQLDGSNIEWITAKWITEDTVDNDDPSLLYVKPSWSDSEQSVRLQVSYALSGEHNYEPGDVTITVPAYIFKDYKGKDYGTMIIPFPEDPSMRGDFNWKLIGDHYVLTNTRRMSAATKGYIQFAFAGLEPHELVDMQESEPFDAYIEVVTHKGNTMALRSNELTAQFDTEAKVTDVTKRVSSGAERVPASAINAASIPDEYKNEKEFILVKWYFWGTMQANTRYQIDYVDSIPSAAEVGQSSDGTVLTESDVHGFIVDKSALNGASSLEREKAYTGYSSGQTSFYYVATAYPASQFEPDIEYTFHNDATFVLTEDDGDATVVNPNVNNEVDGTSYGSSDPKLVTTRTASAKTVFIYTNPEWYDPTGHFMVVKNGNDDKKQNGVAKYNYTHKAYYSGGVSDLHLWSWSPNGWYGIYPSALNDLQDQYAENAENGGVRLSYTIDSVGYVMPWMFDSSSFYADDPDHEDEVASRLSKNYNRPVRMTTKDTGISIGRNGEKLVVGTDYEFVSIEFPDEPWLYTGVPQNINPDGSWAALTAGDGTFKYERDRNKANWPDIDLEIQRGGTWEKWATASWKSGSLLITSDAGAHIEDGVVDVPADTENFRTVVTLQNTSRDEEANLALQAAIDYDVRVVIDLKSTDSLMQLIDAAFEKSNIPQMLVYNSTNMVAERTDVSEQAIDREIVSIDNDGYDSLRGYTTDVMVFPSKTAKTSLSDANYDDRYVTVHFTAKVEERSVINDQKTYEQAVADGRLAAEEHGVWRDLLPKGMTPVVSSVRLRSGDTVADAYTVENYRGTGRTLLVVEADLTPKPERYRLGDMYYYEDVPTITFDATYDFESIIDYGDGVLGDRSQAGTSNRKFIPSGELHNVISFESANDHIGTVEKYSGEPNDPTGVVDSEGGYGNIATETAFASGNTNDPEIDARVDKIGAEEKRALTNVNDRTDASFVYAGTDFVVDYLSAARTSLRKDVMTNNDGWWSSGLYYNEPEENKRTVYEGGQYSYRLRMMSDEDTISKDLVLYDSLENFYAGDGNDEIDIDAPHWQGKFRGLDVSQLESMGADPIVYYSTVENLLLSDENDPRQGNSTNMDLENTGIWVKASEYQGSLDDVKAIAVDASKKPDGSDFELQPLESVVVIVQMKAPAGEVARTAIDEDAHAYNNVYLTCTSLDKDTLDQDGDSFVRFDYTKVGLLENDYTVTKVWEDGNNRDGKRPDANNVRFQLYADGEPYIDDDGNGEEVYATLDPETGKAVFRDLPYTDPDGNKIRYTAREVLSEEDAANYTATYELVDGGVVYTNTHVPERVAVTGEKRWVGDEAVADTARPDSIEVRLYKRVGEESDPVLIRSQVVKPDEAGNWTYAFTNLYKYENGELITYTIDEKINSKKGDSYITTVVPIDMFKPYETGIVNVYHPKGDLVVSKETEHTTDVSADQDFTFTFEFTKGVDEDGKPVPVFDEYDYEVLEAVASDEDGEPADDQPVLDAEGNPVTGKVGTNGTVTIKGGQKIHVKEIDENVQFTVTEASEPGFTQTSASGNKGVITPNDVQQAEFVNTYEASGQINLHARKMLSNHEIKRAQFRYELYSVEVSEDGNEVETLVATASNEKPDNVTTRDDGTVADSSADIVFRALRYTEEDAGKTFTYRIKEVDSGRDGYSYDSNVYTVTVSVADNGDGTLTVTDSVEGVEQTEWKAESLPVTDGIFIVTDPNNIDMSNTLQYMVTGMVWNSASGAEGKQTYQDLVSYVGQIGTVTYDRFNNTSAGKYYDYVSRIEFTGRNEQLDNLFKAFAESCDGAWTYNGMKPTELESYKKGVGKFVIELYGPHYRGTSVDYVYINLKVYPAVEEGEGMQPADAVVFHNGYSASGEVVLRAWKDLRGRTLQDDEFTFELLDENGNVIQVKNNTADGGVAFDPISYDEQSIGKTFHYAIREAAGSDDTVRYDDTVFGYSVLVVDNEDGTLSCIQTPVEPVLDDEGNIIGWGDETADLPVFMNTLETGSLTVGKKVVGSGDADENQEFSFRARLVNNDTANGDLNDLELEGVEGYVVSETDSAQVAEFGFTLKAGETRTFEGIPAGTAYQVYEETPEGWLLVRQDSASGTIKPLVTSESEFTNKYLPDVASVQFTGTKTLDGKAAPEDVYQFALTEQGKEGGTITTIQGGIETESLLPMLCSNSDGGFVQFPIIQYDKTDVGRHVYEVVEIAGDDSTIDYDSHTEVIQVDVFEVDGKLKATVTYDDDGFKFENKTRPGILKIKKNAVNLTDANDDAEFTFKITFNNSNGMPIGSDDAVDWYKEDASGNVIIPEQETQVQSSRRVPARVPAASAVPASSASEPDSVEPVPAGDAVEPEEVSAGDAVEEDAYEANVQQTQANTVSTAAASPLSDVDAPLLPLSTMFSVPAKAPAATSSSSELFHATSDMLVGTAYAVLTPGGELVFFRSNKAYANGSTATDSSPFVDTQGRTYVGTVYSGFETETYNARPGSTYDSARVAPWGELSYRIHTVRIADGYAIRPVSTAYWFCMPQSSSWNYGTLKNVDLRRLDTSKVTRMDEMFFNCSGLQTLDVTSWDTKNVESFGWMFFNCRSFESIDVSNFNTSKATNMNEMFASCSSLKTLDVSNFDTRNVGNHGFTYSNTGFYGMFSGCSSLTTLDLSNFDTSNSPSFGYMFSNCSSLKTIDLSNFNTDKVYEFAGMFYYCTSLQSVNLSSFNTSNGTEFGSMFSGCKSLKSLDLSNFNTAKAEQMYYMFGDCSSLTSLDLSGFNTPKLYRVNNMFDGCTSLAELDLSNFDTRNIYLRWDYLTGMKGMFNNTPNLSSIKVGENFAPKGKNLSDRTMWALFPTPPSDRTTGNWVQVDGYGSAAPEVIQELSSDEIEGTWVWETTKIIVRFDANGGYVSPEYVTLNSTSDAVAIPSSSQTKRPHYELVGWNTKRDGSGTSYAAGSEQSGIAQANRMTTLYAQWKPTKIREFTVKHYLQNTTLDGYSLASVQVLTGEYGTAAVAPLAYGNGDGFTKPATQAPVIAENDSTVIEYYYDRATYDVSFDGNGADSGQMPNQRFAVGVPANLSINVFTKSGSIFKG